MQEKIIQYLKSANGYVSGEEMCRSANISRAAIWKYMQELRKLGYEIVAVPHLGYQLVSSPDKLFPHEVQCGLKTRWMGARVEYHEAIGSTMDEAFRLGMEGAAEGTVVCAETQTKGRGRLGRVWSSPKSKGIYVSIILRPKLAPAELSKLTLMCAVAISEAVEKVTGVRALIKWPNDLLVNGRKLAGILTELRAEVDQMKFVVIGIGLNVNTTAAQLVDGATSLKQENGRTFMRVPVLQEMLRGIEDWYVRLAAEGFDAVIQRWRERSSTLRRRIRVIDPAGVVEGEAMDIDRDGGLLIRQDSGVVVKKMAGDVVQVR